VSRYLKYSEADNLCEPELNITTRTLTRIAILGALVVIFDYTLKFSGWKIPFPWMPVLKFDFTGIPIVLSLLLLGLKPGGVTSVVAFLAILARSGDMVGPAMKALAEFSTILGMSLGLLSLKRGQRLTKPVSFVLGSVVRVLVMALANLLVFTLYYAQPLVVAVAMAPYVAIFNLVQGFVSMFGGYLLYEAIMHRVPFLASEPKADQNREIAQPRT